MEDIIEGFNTYIESIRAKQKLLTSGHVVLRKEIQINSTFKAYKTYRCIIYFVRKSKVYTVYSFEKIAKVIDDTDPKLNKDLCILLVLTILDIANSDYFKQIIEGTYALNRV